MKAWMKAMTVPVVMRSLGNHDVENDCGIAVGGVGSGCREVDDLAGISGAYPELKGSMGDAPSEE
jgi:hypothetical protein